jgi:hypothetical protein
MGYVTFPYTELLASWAMADGRAHTYQAGLNALCRGLHEHQDGQEPEK